MDHHASVLIATIAVGLGLAFVFGMVARRLRLPTLVGYLAAGVLMGPYTIGYVADTAVATELAELGVVLLMFGTGIHFSIRDLLAVRAVAIPGAAAQSLLTTLVGIGVGILLGWGVVGGLVLGLAISVASTVVLLRAIIERGELDSIQGRVAVGWLIVEDILTVVILVLLPSAAPILTGQGGSFLGALKDLAVAVMLAAAFAGIMLVAGTRPRAAHPRPGGARADSRAVRARRAHACRGCLVRGLRGVRCPLALGGFLAGAVVSESDLSHQAAAEATPLRDAFSVLFFVSVGMLVDPGWIVTHPVPVLLVTVVVIVVKFVAAYGVVLGLGYPSRIGLTIGAALSQVGEFTFIPITLGVTLGSSPWTRSRWSWRRRSSPSPSTR
ncbi:MAG: cation:proton antiporter [Chloroflexota bacterium]